MIDDLNLSFEGHDRGRGRRRRTERWDGGAGGDTGQQGWSDRQQGRGDPQQDWGDPRQGWIPPRQADGPADPRRQAGQVDPRRAGAADAQRGWGDPRQQGWAGTAQEGWEDPRDPAYSAGPPPRRDTRSTGRSGQDYERSYDPRYDTGSSRYEQLADDRYDTGQQGDFFEGGFDEPPARGPSEDRQDRRRPRKAKKRRGRSFLALFLTLLLFGGLAGGAYLGYDKIMGYFVTPDYDGSGTAETVQIEVKQDELLGSIATTLVKNDVVKSYKAFVDAADANKDATGIQPGFYTMHKKMSGKAAVAALLDPKNRNVKGVTIPEGMITIDIYAKLSKELKIPLTDFQAAAKDPVKLGIPESWFTRGDGKKAVRGLEGFLYPETYQFPPNVTAETALKLMVQHFLTVTSGMHFAENVKKNMNISPYEALVAASIAQVEAAKTVDMPKVARVLYNRAYSGRFACSCLQIDSAVNYWLRISGKSAKDSNDLTYSQLIDTKNPYRTHVDNSTPPAAGLPIGPISNPGEAALKGAMAPPAGTWTYFMTIDKKGTTGYASSDAEFTKLKRTACQNGVLWGDLC